MQKICLISLLVIFLSFSLIGCGNAKTPMGTPKASINRTFEDLTLGMSETEFKNKLQFHSLGERSSGVKSYVVYARSYILPAGTSMKELDNIEKVFCYFFNGSLCQISIYYFTSVKFSPTWENFISNTKQKYGDGKQSPISNEIDWNDGKTSLNIKEDEEASTVMAGMTDH